LKRKGKKNSFSLTKRRRGVKEKEGKIGVKQRILPSSCLNGEEGKGKRLGGGGGEVITYNWLLSESMLTALSSEGWSFRRKGKGVRVAHEFGPKASAIHNSVREKKKKERSLRKGGGEHKRNSLRPIPSQRKKESEGGTALSEERKEIRRRKHPLFPSVKREKGKRKGKRKKGFSSSVPTNSDARPRSKREEEEKERTSIGEKRGRKGRPSFSISTVANGGKEEKKEKGKRGRGAVLFSPFIIAARKRGNGEGRRGERSGPRFIAREALMKRREKKVWQRKKKKKGKEEEKREMRPPPLLFLYLVSLMATKEGRKKRKGLGKKERCSTSPREKKKRAGKKSTAQHLIALRHPRRGKGRKREGRARKKKRGRGVQRLMSLYYAESKEGDVQSTS